MRTDGDLIVQHIKDVTGSSAIHRLHWYAKTFVVEVPPSDLKRRLALQTCRARTTKSTQRSGRVSCHWQMPSTPRGGTDTLEHQCAYMTRRAPGRTRARACTHLRVHAEFGWHTRYHVQTALDRAASASFELLDPTFRVDRGISLLHPFEKEALVCGRCMLAAVGQRARQAGLPTHSQVGPKASRPLPAGRLNAQGRAARAARQKRNGRTSGASTGGVPHRFRAAATLDMCQTCQAAARPQVDWLPRTLLQRGKQRQAQGCISNHGQIRTKRRSPSKLRSTLPSELRVPRTFKTRVRCAHTHERACRGTRTSDAEHASRTLAGARVALILQVFGRLRPRAPGRQQRGSEEDAAHRPPPQRGMRARARRPGARGGGHSGRRALRHELPRPRGRGVARSVARRAVCAASAHCSIIVLGTRATPGPGPEGGHAPPIRAGATQGGISRRRRARGGGLCPRNPFLQLPPGRLRRSKRFVTRKS